MLTLLKKHFGYDTFRPLQGEIITHVMSGRDALVLMPTGGGKSLCYQLPALALPGITLVVSPLIALMKDQVDALRANGIAAAFLNSTLSFAEQLALEDRIRAGEIKILYVAPERFANPQFRAFLQSLSVSLLAVDEAHCISEWGHDFRPEYRNLKRLREDLSEVPLVALTASATERVRADIISQLQLQGGRVFISSFNRPNLTYTLRPKKNGADALSALLLARKGESAIAYCFSRKDTESLASALKEKGIRAEAYHAGLGGEERKTVQERFIKDEISVVCATIAFGMGIDKPDVRLVAHMTLPKSVEGYYQETGRAGRDGLPADCVLFYSYGDRVKHDFFIDQIEKAEEKERAKAMLNRMVDFAENTGCRRKYLMEYFNQPWPQLTCTGCDNCLTPREEYDATEDAKKVLSGVAELRQPFGVAHVADILRGANKERIRERGHESLVAYGSLKGKSEDLLKEMLRSLVAKGALRKIGDLYPCLEITPMGRAFLSGEGKMFLPKPRVVEKVESSRSASTDTEAPYDRALFEKLRALRLRLARERAVAPFMVFGDRALQDMCRKLPKTNHEFATVHGVGKAKLTEFAEAFLSAIKAHIQT